MKAHHLWTVAIGMLLFSTISFAQNAENQNPYAIFGRAPYVAGEKSADSNAEKVFVIENTVQDSDIARMEHNTQTGRVQLLDKHGKLLKEKFLKAGESGWLTQDRFAEKYYSISPYAYAAGNPIRYIDINGDSIYVAEKYQDQFNQDLSKVFGENMSLFSFNDSGNLIFDGKAKDLSKEQRAVYKGMKQMMNSNDSYSITYENNYTTKDGNIIDVNKDYGGALFDAKANAIVISPSPSGGMVTTMDLKQEYINQTTTTNLFHEIGERNQGKATFRGGAIDYENLTRKILKIAPRPYDIYHQPQPAAPSPYVNIKKYSL